MTTAGHRAVARFCAALLFLASAVAASAGAQGAPASPAHAVFALAAGYNRSPDPTLSSLKYADDDAVRSFLLLDSLGAQAALLTEMDAPTRRLFVVITHSLPPKSSSQAAVAGARFLVEPVV